MEWAALPTLCVGAVLRSLSVRDALTASSACRRWRAALSLYSGEREHLELTARESQHERNALLTQLFRKKLKRLTVVLQCRGRELDKFVHLILARYCRARGLESVEFVATPNYLDFEDDLTVDALRNAITEPLVHSQRHSLRRIVLRDCAGLLPIPLQDPEDPVAYEALRCLSASSVHRRITFLPVHPFPFASLQCIAMDYSSLDDVTLQAFAAMPRLSHIILNVCRLSMSQQRALRWSSLYHNDVKLTLNVISLSGEEMETLKHHVLTDDLPLAVLRLFFCGHMDLELIQRVSEKYCDTLRELHYADPPTAAVVASYYHPLQMPETFVNPFVMLCWQCTKLQVLVIHGYVVESYDLVGMARLRSSTLRELLVSSIQWGPVAAAQMCEEMSHILSFDWYVPTSETLHPALTTGSTEQHRHHYVLRETAIDSLLSDIT